MKKVSLLWLFLVSFSVFAQKLDITVSVNQKPIRVLFDRIEEQTNYQFSYNTTLINADSVITYSSTNKRIEKVISDVFDKRIQAKIIGKHIVLLRSKKAENLNEKNHPELTSFKGRVLDARSNQPVSEASVYDIYSRKSVLTNATGNFEILIDKGNAKNFNIAKSNYRDTVISVNVKEENEIVILLLPMTARIDVSSTNVKDIVLEDNSGFVRTVVPHEGLVTAQNLGDVTERRLFQVSAIPNYGTNMAASGVIENNVSLNILGGYNGGVHGVEVGGLFNILSRNVYGVQIGGLSNVVEGSVNGVQIGGIINFVGDTIKGVQVGGISNVVKGSVHGVQIGGIQNHNFKKMKGFQLGGILNWTQDTLYGMQLAGISNNVKGEVIGLQLAGIQNMSTKNMRGAQISGITNHAFANMNGFQLSFVNIAKVNNGLQFGFVNLADSANGIAIGFFNFVKNGYHPIEIFGNEVLYTNVAFKSGTDKFYTQFTAGFRPDDPELFGLGYGFGTKINTWKWLSISLDATGTFVNESELDSNYIWELNILNRLDLTLDFNIGKFSILAGPALNVHVSQLGFEESGDFTTQLAQNPFYTEVTDGTQIQAWWGAKFGLRYSF